MQATVYLSDFTTFRHFEARNEPGNLCQVFSLIQCLSPQFPEAMNRLSAGNTPRGSEENYIRKAHVSHTMTTAVGGKQAIIITVRECTSRCVDFLNRERVLSCG